MIRSCRRHLQGFTLIEVQIALVLLTIIMVLLFGALHTASKSWKASQHHNQLTENQRVVSEFLRRQLEQMMPLFWSDQRGNRIIFNGEQDKLTYVGQLPANRSKGGATLMTLSMNSENFNSTEFVLSYKDLDPEESPFSNHGRTPASTTLLNNVQKIAFSYYGKENDSSLPARWRDRWNSKKRYPAMIKCQITLTDGTEWPELIIPTHTDDVANIRQFIIAADRNRSISRQANNRVSPTNKPSPDDDQTP